MIRKLLVSRGTRRNFSCPGRRHHACAARLPLHVNSSSPSIWAAWLFDQLTLEELHRPRGHVEGRFSLSERVMITWSSRRRQVMILSRVKRVVINKGALARMITSARH